MSKNRLFRIICFVIFIVATVLVICLEKADDIAYDADAAALKALESSKYVTVKEEKHYIAFEPAGGFYNKGIIFYPGGSVEPEAYAPLMHAVAEEGYLCVIVKMPLKLAVLDANKGDLVRKEYSNVADWYMAGHSLGGVMASSYTYDNASQIQGLILLAAYSTEDISKEKLEVLSIYGSQDGVFNMENYGEYRSNLPGEMTEIVIDGGNHANFGNYGEQSDDGVASIAAEEQQEIVVEAICEMLQ